MFDLLAQQLGPADTIRQKRGLAFCAKREASVCVWGGDGGHLRSRFDDEPDVAGGGQDLAQLGRPEAVGPTQGDALGQPGDKQVLGVHLELGVGHLGRLGEAQSFG